MSVVTRRYMEWRELGADSSEGEVNKRNEREDGNRYEAAEKIIKKRQVWISYES